LVPEVRAIARHYIALARDGVWARRAFFAVISEDHPRNNGRRLGSQLIGRNPPHESSFQICQPDRAQLNIPAGLPGHGGEIAFGFGSVWATLEHISLTRFDASSNVVVRQWVGDGVGRRSAVGGPGGGLGGVEFPACACAITKMLLQINREQINIGAATL
jgi:hypothetical protein